MADSGEVGFEIMLERVEKGKLRVSRTQETENSNCESCKEVCCRKEEIRTMLRLKNKWKLWGRSSLSLSPSSPGESVSR